MFEVWYCSQHTMISIRTAGNLSFTAHIVVPYSLWYRTLRANIIKQTQQLHINGGIGHLRPGYLLQLMISLGSSILIFVNTWFMIVSVSLVLCIYIYLYLFDTFVFCFVLYPSLLCCVFIFIFIFLALLYFVLYYISLFCVVYLYLYLFFCTFVFCF